MVSSDLHALTVRLDVLRDVMIELAAELLPDRAAGVVTAIGNRLKERLCDMEIDKPTDDAMVSDLAPIFAALRHSGIEMQSTYLRPAVARSPVDRPALQSTPLRTQNERVEGRQTITPNGLNADSRLPASAQAPSPSQRCCRLGTGYVPRQDFVTIESAPVVRERRDWRRLVCGNHSQFSIPWYGVRHCEPAF